MVVLESICRLFLTSWILIRRTDRKLIMYDYRLLVLLIHILHIEHSSVVDLFFLDRRGILMLSGDENVKDE
jgi:hypothetical protein